MAEINKVSKGNEISQSYERNTRNLSTKAKTKLDSAGSNLKRAVFGIPKAGCGAGEFVSSVFMTDIKGIQGGLSKVVEGLTDVPVKVMSFSS